MELLLNKSKFECIEKALLHAISKEHPELVRAIIEHPERCYIDILHLSEDMKLILPNGFGFVSYKTSQSMMSPLNHSDLRWPCVGLKYFRSGS
ncbi:unnamed protein product [Schistosoma margrebowiei]|uniref:Uncharacterized protein n=1 Tax=Schistosoma margrebowiei TaxID=48269 RepID=A0A183MCR2_9TREM|nr:unnamed protein product [Schistosoma margrebowiei]